MKTNIGCYEDTGTVFIQEIYDNGQVTETEFPIKCATKVVRLLCIAIAKAGIATIKNKTKKGA